MVIERMDRFLSSVNGTSCLAYVSCLLPLIPPPTGLVILVKGSLFFLLHIIVVMVKYITNWH